MTQQFGIKLAAGLVTLCCAFAALASDVVVIGNKDNPNTVDKAFIARAFSGDAKTWPEGGQVMLIDQAEDNPLRGTFYTSVVGKSASNVKAMWAQQVFSGKALPPKVIDGDAEVKKAVASQRNAIGYIKPSSVDDSVKVLLK
jgi:ABC-type phosphate transport system substrate-binding protein